MRSHLAFWAVTSIRLVDSRTHRPFQGYMSLGSNKNDIDLFHIDAPYRRLSSFIEAAYRTSELALPCATGRTFPGEVALGNSLHRVVRET